MLARRLALGLGLLTGVATSQAPEFSQQYRQRIGGAVDELSQIIKQFDVEAKSEGLERSAALERLATNADILARQRGRAVETAVLRHDRLAAQLQDFATAGPFSRLAVMAKDFDPQVAQRAWSSFEPALPISTEGAASAGVGFIAGYGLWRLLALPFRRRTRPGMNTQRPSRA